MLQEKTIAITSNSIFNQYFDVVNSTNIVSKTDIDGVITYVNDKFIEISGYSEDELLGKAHNIIRDPKLDSNIFKELWSTIKSKQIWNGIITNQRKDGSRYTVNSSIFPILNEQKEITEYIAIRHDVTEILALNSQIEELHNYNVEQEHIAREKLEAGIINDMSKEECQVIYSPSDILSGDFYSIYKREDGSIFIYIMDGQGHGVSPALTVFAISSMMKQVVYDIQSLDELVNQLAPSIKNFLGEIEQLSYTMVMISSDKKKISYASAGMYPFLIKAGDDIIRAKANNTPFMNFSSTPHITYIDIGEWDSLLIYSDGLIEHEDREISHYSPQELITKPSLIQKAIEEVSNNKFDDDITMLYLNNNV